MKSTKIQPEQRLFGYLSEVADEASGKLSPAARIRLVDSLRDTIERERARRGLDLATLDGILRRLGDPVTVVDSEVQRDPDYQARLTARLARASDGPQVPITDDLAALLVGGSPSGGPNVPLNQAAVAPRIAADGPELCLDPDPFAPEHSVETVGALAAPAPPAAATETTMTMILPDLGGLEEPQPLAPAVARIRTAWLYGPKARPWEALAIAVFLVGAVLGQWVVLLLAALIACTSRYFTPVEKWALVVGVPVATGLVYALGFWLHQRGFWGGTAVNTSDLLSGAASFFGTLPRIAALLAALFLSWRLARGITRQL
ncbi:hypothetical protein KGA66_05730 [Actinocrinis puniceicyclus]|uniref:Uncharacterized protein n=1 Tax=Actinocrinis puniceicyclus TaxID=977794 RepID=A0A8J7WMP4_9ACTN|nr:hypothetical protein [Actinocrinis puniceicyclus]MBS2962537.1 hypothetical protein [Actinocrinis puniceicyclus]